MTPNKVVHERPEIRFLEQRVLKAIKERARKQGISDRRLAVDSNMHRSTVRRILEGKSNMELVEFLALCKTVGLNPAPFLQHCIINTEGPKL